MSEHLDEDKETLPTENPFAEKRLGGKSSISDHDESDTYDDRDEFDLSVESRRNSVSVNSASAQSARTSAASHLGSEALISTSLAHHMLESARSTVSHQLP